MKIHSIYHPEPAIRLCASNAANPTLPVCGEPCVALISFQKQAPKLYSQDGRDAVFIFPLTQRQIGYFPVLCLDASRVNVPHSNPSQPVLPSASPPSSAPCVVLQFPQGNPQPLGKPS